MRFIDCNPFTKMETYPQVNEDIEIWRELLQGIRVSKTGGICSGGEVAFFSLLSTARQEAVLVDHSYGSLAYAMAKYRMIEELGWERTYELLSDKDSPRVCDVILQFIEGLPIDTADLKRRRVGDYGDPPVCDYNLNRVKAAWSYMSKDVVRRASKMLDKVTFIHGDLNDLEKHGPFGLLYLSNALEHYGRDGRGPRLNLLRNLVRPGGYVALTGEAYGLRDSGLTLVKTFSGYNRGIKSPAHIGWKYSLYQAAA